MKSYFMHIHKLLLEIGTQVNSLCKEMCKLAIYAHWKKKSSKREKVSFIEQSKRAFERWHRRCIND